MTVGAGVGAGDGTRVTVGIEVMVGAGVGACAKQATPIPDWEIHADPSVTYQSHDSSQTFESVEDVEAYHLGTGSSKILSLS